MKASFVTEKSAKYVKRNAHYEKCRRENQPFVFIAPSARFAWVELDMITTDCNLDDVTRDKIFDAMTKHGVSPKQMMCHHLICRATKVPKGVANSLAKCIYEIASSAMPTLKVNIIARSS